FGAGFFAFTYGPWIGVAGSVALGMVGGLVHALATVVFGVDHIISGVAINIIALGAVQYLAALTFTGVEGGGPTQSPKIGNVPTISFPALGDRLVVVADNNWFFVSEIAAIARALVTNLSVLVLISLALVVLSYVVLWRTAFGLRLRSCGESPAAGWSCSGGW
ncbi:ABC transporter permease subunit, partial [Streptomyces rhizosphaericus]|uniref:ABC transporter permease subunit n=1 Tax=Streptomyces rhizosphaericus TaxID=114699 RepID=UPI003CD0A344